VNQNNSDFVEQLRNRQLFCSNCEENTAFFGKADSLLENMEIRPLAQKLIVFTYKDQRCQREPVDLDR
jgi:hypothetical protein